MFSDTCSLSSPTLTFLKSREKLTTFVVPITRSGEIQQWYDTYTQVESVEHEFISMSLQSTDIRANLFKSSASRLQAFKKPTSTFSAPILFLQGAIKLKQRNIEMRDAN